MDEKKNGCKYFPEIKDCVECEYFREVETDYDVITKCAMYDIELEKKRKKTFAEWAIEYLRERPNCEITLRSGFGLWNDCILQMFDRTKYNKQVTAQQVITNDLLEHSKLTKDELLIYSAERLRKELDKYGC